MKRSDIDQPRCYFDKYIDRVEDADLFEAFETSVEQIKQIDRDSLHRLGNTVYADGKWTSKGIFQHLIDAERILAYRALRIGRNDAAGLSGFDEAIVAANVSTKERNLESLIDEMLLVRDTTRLLYLSFDDTALLRHATINGNQMSTLAYGFTILGHQKYHFDLIEEKYFPLLNQII